MERKNAVNARASSRVKRKVGISGCPLVKPSRSRPAKASRSTRRLRARKAGAPTCGLDPVAPMEWQPAHILSASARPWRASAPCPPSPARAPDRAADSSTPIEITHNFRTFSACFKFPNLVEFLPLVGDREWSIGQGRGLARLNVEHYRKLLAAETDHAKRQTVLQLLTEEEAKLAALTDPPDPPDPPDPEKQRP